jgi:prophage tail gpP-like protein
MPDKVELKINGCKIADWANYSIVSNLWEAAGSFSMTCSYRNVDVDRGDRCELWVNDTLEMTGIIDAKRKGYSKDGVYLNLSGRDLMGLVINAYCKDFVTMEGVTLYAASQKLLKDIPFINRKDIVYGDGAKSLDKAHAFKQIEPGQKVFDTLKDMSTARGLMFYCRPDGTFIFGKPKGRGRVALALKCIGGKNYSSILSAESEQDASQEYSEIRVLGQQQGSADAGPESINTTAVLKNPNAKIQQTYVEVVNEDDESPAKKARFILEHQQASAHTISYKVSGHSQNGINWSTDELCAIEDDVVDINGTYLIYSRTFTLSKEEGYTTELRLGVPGVIGA